MVIFVFPPKNTSLSKCVKFKRLNLDRKRNIYDRLTQTSANHKTNK